LLTGLAALVYGKELSMNSIKRKNKAYFWNRTPGERVFNVFNLILMFFLLLITLLPFWHIFMGSFSDTYELYLSNGLVLWPLGKPTIDTYAKVLSSPETLSGFANSLFYVIVGTAISMILTINAAYAISRKGIFIKPIMFLFLLTMFFNGGLIPTYLIMDALGLINSRWAILFSHMISCWNIIILRTAFKTVPQEMTESAKIDGANDLIVLWRIFVPLSITTLAVIGLFIAVTRWNDWITSSIYLRDRRKYPIQLFLREILILAQTAADQGGNQGGNINTRIASVWEKRATQYTTIIVASAPIIMVYPFIQKYFVKGIMLGSLKG
jgi:putative aldouronate transport system permease protein